MRNFCRAARPGSIEVSASNNSSISSAPAAVPASARSSVSASAAVAVARTMGVVAVAVAHSGARGCQQFSRPRARQNQRRIILIISVADESAPRRETVVLTSGGRKAPACEVA